jgi:hypothetical protein
MSNLQGKLSTVAAARLVVDKEFVRLEWDDVIENADTLMAAAEFLALVAAPGGTGVYR